MITSINIAPELVMETIISYTNQSTELFKSDLDNFPKWEYSLWFFPLGHKFFSWPIQSLWYSTLWKFSKNKKIILAFSQNKIPNKILLAPSSIWPHLWKHRIIPKIESFSDPIIQKTNKKTYTTQIINQIDFLRVLTDYEEFIPIFIGNKVPLTKIYKILNSQEIKTNYTILFFENLNTTNDLSKTEKDDEKILNQIINNKPSQNTKNKNHLLYIFSKLSNKQSKTPQILNYFNSAYLHPSTKESTWYACIFS